jgi:zinc/manganese transport system ATP-binding protein
VDGPVVLLENVTTAYEGESTPTLHHISLHLDEGERVAIVGPNGAGKTTLLEVVNGLLPATEGVVRVFGRPVCQQGHWLRARIAYMAQDVFFEAATPFLVSDVVMAALYGQVGLLRRPSNEHKRRVREALRTVGLEDLRRRPVGRLSGGQQRKVLLARALAQGARLLLLDEPTANLDPEAKTDVARIVREIESALDATALVVSHEGGPLLEDAQRWIHVENGRIARDVPLGARAQGGT